MTTACLPTQLEFHASGKREVAGRFDGGHIASDGGGLILRRGIRGAQRITRHLWRMCMARFIAATSYFLGQPDFVPPFMRGTAWFFVPSLATLAVMAYWLVRGRFGRTMGANPAHFARQAESTR